MQAIRYRYHFAALAVASIPLWLILRTDDFLRGDTVFFLTFGSMGALHATAVVVSLRDKAAVKPIKVVVFVSLVAALSIGTPASPLLLGPLIEKLPGNDSRLFFALGFASAVGASAYWLLLRVFWLKSQKWVNLIVTALLCACATVLCWFGAGALNRFGAGPPTWSAGQIADVLPTVGWWAVFSLGLYCNDVDWNADSSKPTRPEDAHA